MGRRLRQLTHLRGNAYDPRWAPAVAAGAQLRVACDGDLSATADDTHPPQHENPGAAGSSGPAAPDVCWLARDQAWLA
jgi:hypothetical protein